MSKKEEMKETLTYSRLMSFMDCPRKEYYQYRVEGVGIKSTEPYLPFIEGELGHYALANYYKSGQMLRQNMIDRVEKMIEDLGALDPVIADGLRTKLSAMIGACLGYKGVYYDDIDRTNNKGKVSSPGKFDVLLVEEPFMFEFAGYAIQGKIDLVLRDRETKAVILMENKFVSQLSINKYVQLPIDLQGLIYCEGVKAILGQYPDQKGWNFIRKSQLRRKGKIEKGNLESLPSFEARVQEQYVEEPEKMFFRPPPLKVQESVLKNVSKQLEVIIARLKDKPHMNFSSCLGMYGTVCPFIQACTSFLAGHKDGWDAGECKGLFKLKEAQHEELGE